MEALRRFGVDETRNDFAFVQTGEGAAGLAALTNGTIDAMVMLSYAQAAAAQGFRFLVYGPDLRIPYAAAMVVGRHSLVTQRPRVFANFMYAMAEASKIFHTDTEFVYKVLSKYLRITNRQILETSYALEKPAMEPMLTIRPEALQALLKEIALGEARVNNVKPEQLIDERYLDEMKKSGFLDKLWGTKS